MAPRSRRTAADTDDEVLVAGDWDQPVRLYDTEGRHLDVFTQTELTRYRSWGYSETDPAEHVDQPVDTPTS